MTAAEPATLTPDMFPPDYRAKMIAAYPVIAHMSADEAWFSTAEERDEAFQRILDARNLRRTHELFLEASHE